jgi:hypothetical protein
VPTVSLTCDVPVPAHTMWSAVVSPIGFRFVSRGLIRWPVAAVRTSRWMQGETVVGWMFLLGILPMSRHSLTFEGLDDAQFEFSTRERGGPIRSWNHRITVTPIDDSSCRIHDRVTFDGGVLTPFLWVLVRLFYVIRRPRWQQLATALRDGTVVIG